MPNDMWTVLAPSGLSAGVMGQAGSNPSNQSLGGPVAGGVTPPGGGGAGTVAPAPAGPAPSPFSSPIMVLPFLVLAFFVFSTWRRDKAEKKKRAELIDAMGKGDLVQMVGGEIGTVFDVREQEVVVKFEEGKVRYVKTAVVTILKSARAKEGAPAAIEAKDVKEAAKA